MKLTIATFIPAVLGSLGLKSFSQVDGHDSLTDEECEKLKGYGFTDQFLNDFKAHIAQPKAEAKDNANEDSRAAAVAAVLAQVTAKHESVSAELDELKKKSESDSTAHASAIAEKESEISALKEKINTLSAMPETENAGSTVPGKSNDAVFNLADTKQLGGMPGEHYSMSRGYNQRARAAMLAANGMEPITVASASSVDYKNLQDDLGAFYRTPWTQRIQSFLTELPSITAIFPTEAGHQNLDTLVNVWLGEFSQADTSGGSEFDKVTKGSFEFGTETLRMNDVMFAHKFKNLKTIEKSWIAYLNREGSSPLKLSFIEFLLVEVAKALHNEQQLRFVNGVRKAAEEDKPGSALAAGDGFYEMIRKYVDGHVDFTPNGGTSGKKVFQVKPFELPRITPGNIGEVFYLGTSMIPAQYRDTGKIVLYVPSFMIPLYHKYNEAKYGQNTDYKPGIDYVKEYPSVRIVAIPNADNHNRIVWTFDGNFKTYTYVANEMFKFTLEQQDWSLKVWSNWKEAIQAEAVGYKYTSKADMDGSRQMIWCNDYDRPETFFIDGEKDANPSALLHTSIVTAANKSVFDIKDILDAEVGAVISLKCGADGDAGVTITKKDKFELLSADWKPSKGDIIKVMKRKDGKFIEISRATVASESYQFDADETTPNLAGATVFVTGANTQTTEITDFENAIAGVVYTIHGHGKENASTISNGGKFVLTDVVKLEEGKFVKIVKAGQGSDAKFYEVERN